MSFSTFHNDCEARPTSTGDFVCNRCGCQWDKDDEAPVCLTNQQIAHNNIDKALSNGERPPTLTTVKRVDLRSCGAMNELIVKFNNDKYVAMRINDGDTPERLLRSLQQLANIIKRDIE